MHTPEPFRVKAWRAALGVGVGALALTLALQKVDFRQVLDSLAQADLFYLSLALGGVLLSHLAKTLRWKVLLSPAGKPASLLLLLAALSVSQMLNLVIPFRVGEASRLVLMGRKGFEPSFVLGTIILEKFLDLLTFALFFIFLLVLLPLPDWLGQSANVFLGLTLAASLVMLGALTFRRKVYEWLRLLIRVFPGCFQARFLSWLQSGFASLEVISSRQNIIQLAVLSAVVWSAAWFTNQMVVQAIHLQAPFAAALLALVALQAVFSLPSAPGKVGTFEYICILVLAVFGIAQPQALSYGILLHGVAYLPVILAGLVFSLFLGLGAGLFQVEEN